MKEEQKRQISETLKRKGIKPPSFKGKKHTKETKLKMSKIRTGKVLSEETKKKISNIRKEYLSNPKNNPRFGKPVTSETRKRISERKKGMIFSMNHRMKLSIARQGKKLSQETRNKMSESRKGLNHPMWKGGISGTYRDCRTDRKWNEIKRQIYKRDNYTCQKCWKTGIRICAHHKIPYCISFDDSPGNLITLCQSCHIKEEWKYHKSLKSIWGENLIQEFPS